MGWLDRWFQDQGGRRGRTQVRTATTGLTFAVTRHATSQAGDLIAEVAPRLYGHDPTELDRVVDRVLASRAVVPLIGMIGAHEQAYATAEVLATEAAIADTIHRLSELPGTRVDPDVVERTVRTAEDRAGRVLTAGQVAAVRAVCSSGRAVDVVIGVAGAGKTTALDTARHALEDAGYGRPGSDPRSTNASTVAVRAP